jgi:hypothetical protein
VAELDRRPVAETLSAGLLAGLIGLVPLAVWPGLAEPFTSAKWHVLGAGAAAWLVVERFLCRSHGLPGLVRRTWPAWAALGVSIVAGSLRLGPGWAVQPLTARAAFVALALASFWNFRRNGLGLDRLGAGLLPPMILVTGIGLAQLAGIDPLHWLAGGDHRSATFGNVNMAAQFLGIALVVRLAVPRRDTPPGSRLADAAADLLAGAGLAYVGLAGTRSFWLALGAAVLVLVSGGRLTARRFVRTVAAAGLLAGLVLAVAPGSPGPLEPTARESKRLSALWRLAVWSDTLALVRDHPAGIGAGSFEHAFIPYALAGRSKPGETTVFRSPHNEYLRLVAEEGIGGALLLLGLLVALARALARSPAVAGWRSPPGALLAACCAFLAVEAFFQFPFELAFPSLLAAVLLGLAFACAEEPPAHAPAEPSRRRTLAGDAACVMLALALVGGVAVAAGAERLASRAGGDPVPLERACALDPRRLEACVEAAWRRGRAGDHEALREGAERALARSPHYFPALKLLGEDRLSRGDVEGGCRLLRRYDALFGGRSSVSDRVRAACSVRSAEGG